jgi:glucose-6-phosphate isomerase
LQLGKKKESYLTRCLCPSFCLFYLQSNGKSVTKDNLVVDYNVGEVDFGEPGTNGQHSFYQLMHMGQTIPSDFIGFLQSQHDLCVDGEILSSHDELMSNFFAQPDALAKGKTPEEVKAEGVPDNLIPHKTFTGNRPSSSLMLPQLTAYACGQLLAVFEHRTAVQGFIWDINSFDQWGVELGKKLALDVKNNILEGRSHPGKIVDAGSPATTRILNYYIQNSHQSTAPNKTPVNQITSVKRRKEAAKGHIRDRVPPSKHDLRDNSGKLSNQ